MRKLFLLPLFTIPLLLTLFFTTNSYAQDITACKLSEDLSDETDGLGFPVPDIYASALGTVSIKVLFVDFPDAPAIATPAAVLDEIDDWADFYTANAYGRMTLQFDAVENWYRMDENSDTYLGEDGAWDTMVSDAIVAADPDTDFSTADAVYVITSDAVDYDNSFHSIIDDVPADGVMLSNVAVSSEDYFTDEFVHQIIAHELGHVLGLIDLYPSEDDPVETYVGEFDVMGNLWGRAPEFFAYHRWRLGWLDDDQIHCFQEDEEDFAYISAIEDEGGPKAIIIPVNDHQLIVVESRRARGYDSALLDDGGQEGALVYTIDSDLETAAAGIIVYPDLGDGKIEAPLMDGESVTIGDVTIEVIDADANGDTVLINMAGDSPAEDSPAEEITEEGFPWAMSGEISYPRGQVPAQFNAGYSMYVAAYPMTAVDLGLNFHSGLPGTWVDSAVEGPYYSTIEGGLGWGDQLRFGTATPKFTMGGVISDEPGFGENSEWTNGPYIGGWAGDIYGINWEVGKGRYGSAQLSPYVLWAPDGLNLKQGTNGELFGYGYHPLPLIDEQTDTAGTGITTGNRSWTLFLNTNNFKGPISFIIPNFYTQLAPANPDMEGLLLDSNPSRINRQMATETHLIPSFVAQDANGTFYAHTAQIQYPANDDTDSSIIVNSVSSYSHAALWDSAGDWFAGGSATTGQLDPAGTFVEQFEGWIDTTYSIGGLDIGEHPIDWASFATADASDPTTYKFDWNMDIVKRVGDNFYLPTYFRLDENADGTQLWRVVDEADVPAETGFADQQIERIPTDFEGVPHTTPQEPDSLWKSPGPVAGPFQAELGDGSVITYHWYRFVDQPAILYWEFSEAERDAMQARVEQIHRDWGKDETYMAPPTAGQLADLDPNIIVTPPAGLEVGYVPIVTRQELSSAAPLAVTMQSDSATSDYTLSAVLIVVGIVGVMSVSYRALRRTV